MNTTLTRDQNLACPRPDLSNLAEEAVIYVSNRADEVECGIAEDAYDIVLGMLSNPSSDKATYVIREIFSNAYDASIKAGAKSIEIDFENNQETFAGRLAGVQHAHRIVTVTDHGCGMSYDEVKRHFTQYGGSDKRDDVDAIGSKGLGCLSPFSLSEHFSVTTCKDGMCTTAIFTKGARNSASISTCPTSNHNGTSVRMEIDDASEFERMRRAALWIAEWCRDIDIVINGDHISKKLGSEYVKLGDIATGDVAIPVWAHKDAFPLYVAENIDEDFYAIIGGFPYQMIAESSWAANDIAIELPPGFLNFDLARDAIVHDDAWRKLRNVVVAWVRSWKADNADIEMWIASQTANDQIWRLCDSRNGIVFSACEDGTVIVRSYDGRAWKISEDAFIRDGVNWAAFDYSKCCSMIYVSGNKCFYGYNNETNVWNIASNNISYPIISSNQPKALDCIARHPQVQKGAPVCIVSVTDGLPALFTDEHWIRKALGVKDACLYAVMRDGSSADDEMVKALKAQGYPNIAFRGSAADLYDLVEKTKPEVSVPSVQGYAFIKAPDTCSYFYSCQEKSRFDDPGWVENTLVVLGITAKTKRSVDAIHQFVSQLRWHDIIKDESVFVPLRTLNKKDVAELKNLGVRFLCDLRGTGEREDAFMDSVEKAHIETAFFEKEIVPLLLLDPSYPISQTGDIPETEADCAVRVFASEKDPFAKMSRLKKIDTIIDKEQLDDKWSKVLDTAATCHTNFLGCAIDYSASEYADQYNEIKKMTLAIGELDAEYGIIAASHTRKVNLALKKLVAGAMGAELAKKLAACA